MTAIVNEHSIDFEAEIGVGMFPIVCVGGSAGGLDALIRLLPNLPCDMGGRRHRQSHHDHADPEMPESAIDSGCIDFILSPEAIAGEIVRIVRAE